ncbi:hypothetical protein D9619_003964 [Psilocybe cf. subviscida]|uniref:DUF7918 domain-containing protein n=1 Tax=Psilocybe cf. subviscida TaxID=2480587 RepID=A0A8H5BPL3_9AGAR|nr:hypothetical protein D9619_003964 [Psilocybe cf. subviscida]
MPHKLEANGLAAWIQVDRKKLECYGTSKDTRSQAVSCWIASRENETFSVNLSKATRNLACVAYLFLDGHQISKKLMKGSDTTVYWYRKIVDGYRRPYTFSSQIVGDDDALLDSMNVPTQSRIGEIKICIKRISGLKTIRIHETHVKALKAPHQIALGEPTTKEVCGHVRHSSEYSTKETLATFTFRYRPLDTLVDNGIAPAPEEGSTSVAPRPQSRNGRLKAESQQTILKFTARQHSSPPPVASSSRLRPAGMVTARTESSRRQAAVSSDHAEVESGPSASFSSAMARTLAIKSESKSLEWRSLLRL